MKHREGELYRVIHAHGKSFEIYYGYYDDKDRQNPNSEPMEMYPSFKESPIYTDEGIPFVTAMQTPCHSFMGEREGDDTCYQCAYYKGCEELLGICLCPSRRRQ